MAFRTRPSSTLRQARGTAACFASSFALALLLISGARSEEPARKFLDELRARGMHDMAVAYLERLQDSPNLPADLRDTLKYEQAVTLVQSVLEQREYPKRERQLKEAEATFAEFLRSKPSGAIAYSARTQQAKVQFERARIRILRLQSPSIPDTEKTILAKEAIQFLDEARNAFDDNKTAIGNRLQQIPKRLDPKSDSDLLKEQSQLRNDYVQVQFQAGLVEYEKSRALEADSDQRTATLKSAYQRFETIATKYRRRSIEAVFYQGLCQQDMGDLKAALGFYSELTQQDSSDPTLRRLKTKALKQSIECWTDKEVKQYGVAITQGDAWLEKQRSDERRSIEWNGLKIALAKAHLANANSSSGREKQHSMTTARRLSNEVSGIRGPFQAEAQQLVSQIGQTTRLVANESRPQPKSFDEARESVNQIREQHQLVTETLKRINGRLGKVTNAESRKELNQKVEELGPKVEQLRRDAVAAINTAIDMASEEVPLAEINTYRYHLSYFYYLLEDDFRASVIGSFLGTRYPESTGSRQAARISLAAMVRLYESDESFKESLMPRITETAALIRRNWKGSVEADAALSVLTTFAIRNSDFAAAEKYLSEMPSDSPSRAGAELSTGLEIWRAYNLRRRDQPEGEESDELKRMRERALSLIQKGIEGAPSGQVTGQLLRAVLALAQYYIDRGDFKRAVELLDDENTGPHRLALNASTAATLDESLRQNALVLAIQAYVGMMEHEPSSDASFDRVMKSLDGLKAIVGKRENGQEALVNEYIKLAQRLQLQVDKATPHARNSLAKNYQSLLDQVAKTSTDSNVLLWSAESLSKLGQSMKSNGRLSLEGQQLVQRASAIYNDILKDTKDETTKLSLHLQIAITRRAIGDFEGAIAALFEILKFNETQVYVQIEAARTYQAWGDEGETSDRDIYRKAMQGDRPITTKNRNLIWGWGKIGQLLGRNPKFRAQFHEARYNLAVCRYKYAIKSPQDEREKLLRLAKNDVLFTFRLYPELGGDAQRIKYDGLLRDIQRQLGESPTGLPAQK